MKRILLLLLVLAVASGVNAQTGGTAAGATGTGTLGPVAPNVVPPGMQPQNVSQPGAVNTTTTFTTGVAPVTGVPLITTPTMDLGSPLSPPTVRTANTVIVVTPSPVSSTQTGSAAATADTATIMLRDSSGRAVFNGGIARLGASMDVGGGPVGLGDLARQLRGDPNRSAGRVFTNEDINRLDQQDQLGTDVQAPEQHMGAGQQPGAEPPQGQAAQPQPGTSPRGSRVYTNADIARLNQSDQSQAIPNQGGATQASPSQGGAQAQSGQTPPPADQGREEQMTAEGQSGDAATAAARDTDPEQDAQVAGESEQRLPATASPLPLIALAALFGGSLGLWMWRKR